MSDQSPAEGWTLETLYAHWSALREADKEAVSTALAAAEKAVAAAMAASEKAILKAENAADKRADASNEIRGAMVDAQKNFADKESTERRLKILEDADIAGRSSRVGNQEGRTDARSNIGIYISLAGVLIALAIALAALFGPGA